MFSNISVYINIDLNEAHHNKPSKWIMLLIKFQENAQYDMIILCMKFCDH